MNACRLTVKCCEILASSITSSHLRELDLGNNNLTDEGVLPLFDSLKKSKIETLRSVVNIPSQIKSNFPSPRLHHLFFFVCVCVSSLRSCNLTEKCSAVLASVISSASSKLKSLDLSDNDFQDVGVQNLCGGLGSPHCELETLR